MSHLSNDQILNTKIFGTLGPFTATDLTLALLFAPTLVAFFEATKRCWQDELATSSPEALFTAGMREIAKGRGRPIPRELKRALSTEERAVVLERLSFEYQFTKEQENFAQRVLARFIHHPLHLFDQMAVALTRCTPEFNAMALIWGAKRLVAHAPKLFPFDTYRPKLAEALRVEDYYALIEKLEGEDPLLLRFFFSKNPEKLSRALLHGDLQISASHRAHLLTLLPDSLRAETMVYMAMHEIDNCSRGQEAQLAAEWAPLVQKAPRPLLKAIEPYLTLEPRLANELFKYFFPKRMERIKQLVAALSGLKQQVRSRALIAFVEIDLNESAREYIDPALYYPLYLNDPIDLLLTCRRMYGEKSEERFLRLIRYFFLPIHRSNLENCLAHPKLPPRVKALLIRLLANPKSVMAPLIVEKLGKKDWKALLELYVGADAASIRELFDYLSGKRPGIFLKPLLQNRELPPELKAQILFLSAMSLWIHEPKGVINPEWMAHGLNRRDRELLRELILARSAPWVLLHYTALKPLTEAERTTYLEKRWAKLVELGALDDAALKAALDRDHGAAPHLFLADLLTSPAPANRNRVKLFFYALALTQTRSIHIPEPLLSEEEIEELDDLGKDGWQGLILKKY